MQNTVLFLRKRNDNDLRPPRGWMLKKNRGRSSKSFFLNFQTDGGRCENGVCGRCVASRAPLGGFGGPATAGIEKDAWDTPGWAKRSGEALTHGCSGGGAEAVRMGEWNEGWGGSLITQHLWCGVITHAGVSGRRMRAASLASPRAGVASDNFRTM